MIVSTLAGIRGHIDPDELRLLYRYAKELDKGNILEIGSFQGLSTIAMAKGLQDSGKGGKIYAVDPHEPYVDISDTNPKYGQPYGYGDMAQFLRNVVRYSVEDTVFPIALPRGSIHVYPKFSMVFIDGDHTYWNVKYEIELFVHMLEKHERLLIHDSEWDGPKRAIADIIKINKCRHVERVESLTVLEKI